VHCLDIFGQATLDSKDFVTLGTGDHGLLSQSQLPWMTLISSYIESTYPNLVPLLLGLVTWLKITVQVQLLHLNLQNEFLPGLSDEWVVILYRSVFWHWLIAASDYAFYVVFVDGLGSSVFDAVISGLDIGLVLRSIVPSMNDWSCRMNFFPGSVMNGL